MSRNRKVLAHLGAERGSLGLEGTEEESDESPRQRGGLSIGQCQALESLEMSLGFTLMQWKI